MRLAIIGVGNVGAALAAAASRAGHHVTVTAVHRDHADKVAQEAGAVAVDTVTDAAAGADAVVIAVPHTAAGDVLRELSAAGGDPVVIDPTNPLNADFSDLTTVGTSAAEQLAAQAPNVRIVKAFNTVLASRHADTSEDGKPLDGFYAGDDVDAKAIVAALLDSLGYRPIDAGGLRMARSLEELAFLNIRLNARNGWSWQSAVSIVGPTS